MKKTTAIILIALITILCFCSCDNSNDMNYYLDKIGELQAEINATNSLFYQNAFANFGSQPLLGDPYLYYEESEKTFFLYGTTGGGRFDYYTTTDLINWEYGGTCFQPTESDWCHSRLWAPEMHKIGGKYWLYYSAAESDRTTLHCSVAVSDSPRGPFTNDIDLTNNITGDKPRFDFRFATIDGSVFEDDDGSLYYYFAKDQVYEHINGNNQGEKANVSTIWGVKLENPYTPIGEPTQLTRVGLASMTDDSEISWEKSANGYWNEGPFMIKHNGTYYLTYSANYFNSRYYGVGYATSTDPLSNFVKGENSLVLGIEHGDNEWDFVSGTGHHMFLNIGDESFIVYHKHYNIVRVEDARIFAIDRYGFREDGSLYVNGPSIAPTPKPTVLNGYKNVTDKAVVSGVAIDEKDARTLTDGCVGVYKDLTLKTDVLFGEGRNTLTLTFDEPTVVKSILVYGGSIYEQALKNIEKIEIDDFIVENIGLDGNYVNTRKHYIAPLTAMSVTLSSEIKVNQIKITFNSNSVTSLSEITVLGK